MCTSKNPFSDKACMPAKASRYDVIYGTFWILYLENCVTQNVVTIIK